MKSTIRHLIIRLARIRNRKTILVTAIVIVLIKTNEAQNIQINPSVQPTNGGHTRVGNFSLDYTVGEPVYTPLVNGNLMLTQGFQQPEKPLPPVVPALQAACSDTTHIFTFSNVRAGAGGDLILWSLHSNFDTSYTINNGDSFSISVNAGQMDTIWLKSRYSGNGFASESVYTVASVSPFPLQKTIYAKDTLVLKDSSTQVLIINSENGVIYLLKNGSVVTDSAEGTGDTLWLNTKAISANAILRVIAKDTITGCFVQLADTFQVNIFPFIPVRHDQRLSLEILLNQPSKTFFQIKADADAYIDSLRQWENLSAKSRGEEPELQEDGEEVHYGRWLDYWSNRIDSNGSANRAVEQMSGYLTGIVSDDCSPSEIDMKWKCLGPFSEPSSMENQGRITAIEVDPADHQKIFAGSSNGGVWKTADGGAHWFNCTDSSNFGGMGIGSIAINPNQRNHIVAATGKGSNSVWATTEAINYSIGAIESLDGGNTWHTTPLTLTIPQNASPLPWGDLMTTIKVWYNPKDTIETWYGLTTIGLYRIRNQVIDTIYETARNPHCLLNGGPDSTYLYPVKIVDMLPDKENGKIFYLTLTSHWEAQWCPEAINPYSHEVWKFDLSTQPVTITKNIASTIDLANSSLTYFDSVGNAHHFVSQDIKDMVVSLTDSVHSMLSRLYIKVRLTHDTAERVAIFYSDNGGATWNTTPKIQQTQMQVDDIVDNFGFFYVSPKNENVVYGNTLIPGAGSVGAPNRSIDGGETYLSLNNSRHADLRAFNLFNPSPFDTTSKSTSWAGDGILIGNDGGICIKPIGVVPNTSTGFHHINGYGLAIGQYYGLGNTEKDINTIIAGALDGSISAFVSKEWNDCLGAAGDRGDCLNQYGTNNWIEESNWHQELRNRNNSACNGVLGWGVTNNTLIGPGVYNFMPMANYDRNRNEYYIGYANVFRTTNLNNDSLGAVSVKFSPITDVSAHASNNYPLDGYRVSSIATGYDNTHNRKIIYYSLKDQYRSYYYTPSGGTSHPMPPTYGIYKSEDDGVTWVPKDSGLYNQGPLDNAGITDIAVDKNYADHIFISFGRFSIGNKVFESVDGGHHWHNISGCLPNFPVNSLIYQPEADRIIAGTDVGVYYRDIYTDSMWVKMAGLPDVIVLDMELHNCGQKLQIATYGRSIWEADLPPLPPYTLATDETWNSSQSRNETVIIPNGYVLHITGSSTIINMARGTSIIVEPGGKLQIDNGATVTNGCGAMWGGIIVQGNKTQPQDLSTGTDSTALSAHQGYFYSNNATIENALEALRVWHPSDGWVDINKDSTRGGTGGIIRAWNTTFKNNRRSAEFMWYKNMIFSEEQNNLSYFKNCTFKTDSSHISEHPFSVHVTMWGTRGIKLDNCIFQNDNIRDNVGQLGHGIYSIDADYNVKSSSFKGFWHALWANAGWGLNIVNVTDCTFEDNFKGVSLYNTTLSTIANNTFKSGKVHVHPSGISYYDPQDAITGAELNASDMFTFEQNSFEATDTMAAIYTLWTTGTWANNTGTFTNEIKRNTYDALPFGIGVNGENRDSTGITGLKMGCNEHTAKSVYDFFVQGDNDTSTNDGIRAKQGEGSGTNKTAIGNLFNTPEFQGTTVAEGDYFNHASQPIDYYWSDTIQKPVYYTTSTITLLFANNNSVCTDDTTVFCYWCMLDGSQISQMTSDLNDYHSTLTLKRDTLYSLMDEGNRSSLISDIQGTTSGTAVTMKNRLVSDGPYVSAKAIKLVGRMTSVFTDTMFFEVVSANPDVKNESSFNDYYVEKKKFLPSWIVDSINAIHPLTARTTRENEISSLADTVHGLVKLLAKDAVNDTSGIRHQSLRDCLSKLETTEGALLIAKDLMETNEFSEADSLVTALANATVEGEEKERLQEQITVTRIQLRNMSNGKSIMQIGQTDRDSLIAVNGMELQGDTIYSPRRAKHAAGTLAGNILRSFYQSDSTKTYWEYYEEPKFPTVNGHTRMDKKDDDEKPKKPVREIKDLVKVYPNPAKSILNIKYETTEAEVYIRVTDLLGRELFSKKSIGGKNTEVIATQNWSNGTYIYEIRSVNRRIGSGIFMISR